MSLFARGVTVWHGIRTSLQECFDWLLPPACQLCGKTLPELCEPHLCGACLGGFLPLNSPRCPFCLLPHATAGGADYPCEGCLRAPLPITGMVALGLYQEGLREAVHRFKFRNAIGLQRPLGQLLAASVAGRWEDDLPEIVVPVPLHRTRLRQRGYNQALLLAQEIGRRLDLKMERGLLQRSVATTSQQELPLIERQRNVKGAFTVLRPLNGERFLLVDDVLTTGATVRHCAESLLAAGASAVDVAVLARAPRPGGDDLSLGAVHG